MHVLLTAQPKQHAALHQLLPADLAQPVGVAGAETQDLEVVPRLGAGQREHSGREEHGLVVRVRDQEAHALVAQHGEPGLRDGGRVDV